ncbi:MAG: 3-deoxy-manno-octulosonate cytidylyltransferase, partial [Rhodospirillales bacterium]
MFRRIDRVSAVNMNPIIIIPARMASTRLPGKPLIDICGEPMIIHVLRQAERADIGPVYVAAADQEIVEVVGQAGGKALITDPDLPSGSDRVF